MPYIPFGNLHIHEDESLQSDDATPRYVPEGCHLHTSPRDNLRSPYSPLQANPAQKHFKAS
jgi:hypothetical protein